MKESLFIKEKKAIQFIKQAYQLALQMCESGFHVAFSGGKDSQVLYHLMELSGCKFTAHMQVTSVDPPQVMKFVRNNYSNVELHIPKENMRKLIVRQGMLPMRQTRFCCSVLKEQAGGGTCTCVGVRSAESSRRAKRKEVELYQKKTPKNKPDLEIQGLNIVEKHNVQFDLFDVNKESVITCVKGNDKIILSPIFHWSNADVWNWIKGNNIDYCELYDMGFSRIGCMFCPMRSDKIKMSIELKLFRREAEKIYIRAIKELMDIGKYQEFGSPEEVFMWWISNLNRDKWIEKNKLKTF